MSVVQYILLYVLTVPVFFAIDMLWLGVVARSFYRAQLGHLLGPVNWQAAVVFYLLYIAGIIIFAVLPGLKADTLVHTAMLGALFGFLAYATYDLTNLATLKDWPLALALVDMLWGAVLTGLVAGASFLLAKHVLL